jgi:hypothetical protein
MFANKTNFYNDIHIETKCDKCGKPIVIDVENEALVSFSPATASIIIGGTGCMSNKIACSDACKTALLAAAPSGATAKTVADALKMALAMDKWKAVGAIPGRVDTYQPIPRDKWVVEEIKPITTVAKSTALEKSVDSATKTASDAASKANSASTTASDAASEATNAVSTATDASTKADDAATKASTATNAADEASRTADDASSKATEATSTANDALNAVNNATTLTYAAIAVAIVAIVVSVVSMVRRRK